jgi:hypothetical protein
LVNLLVGNSVSNKSFKVVTTTRTVDVFVSRRHPTTKDAELTDSVNSINNDLKLVNATCVKLSARYKDLYSSYYIAMRVDGADLKKALEIFMSAEARPTGVLVHFKPKNVVTPQS